jgi:hypothetical protein
MVTLQASRLVSYQRVPQEACLTLRRQGAALDWTRQFRRARTPSAPQDDATCRRSALISLLQCAASIPAMLQHALRHRFWMVPSN